MALDIAKFRAMFPAFADETKYPDEMITGYFEFAECWLGEYYPGCPCSDQMYYLLTAHLLFGMGQANAGTIGGAGAVVSSTVGGVSVTLSRATPKSEWRAWLMGSPYGPLLLALLQRKAGGGRYIGGSAERFGFRKIGGTFRP